MIRLTQIKLPLDHNDEAITAAITKKLRIPADALNAYTIIRRGQDARKRDNILLVYTLDVDVANEKAVLKRLRRDKDVSAAPQMAYQYVAHAPDGEMKGEKEIKERPIVIGMGPCGIFAGLLLAQMGFRPIIIERGKPVRERTKDTFAFWRKGELNPDSNVQYGEGGAGLFSDGKLYSQVKRNRALARKVKEEFVRAGAADEIVYVSKPHIGTLRLVKIVANMREEILRLGGEIRFETMVDEIIIEDGQVEGVVANGEVIDSKHVVLAVGHSARPTFEMLHKNGVTIEPKPFSIGVRIEHPQTLLDECRFGQSAKHPILGAADYRLVHHASNGRSVYSFCMCPGGVVVAAASDPETVVTNGMSYYSRAERNANAGIVVGITPDDYPDNPHNPLAGITIQRELERKAFELGGGTYNAPGQTVGDFLAGRPSTTFGTIEPSYQPGVTPTDLAELLPDFAVEAMREALPAFGRQLPIFALEDGIMTGVETRTSSPIRITRGDDGQSLNVRGLFPAGEGAGYAGGILSAGVDGIRAAEAVAVSLIK